MKISIKFFVPLALVVSVMAVSCGGEKTKEGDGDVKKDSVKTELKVHNVADVPGAKIAWANSDTVTLYYTLAIKMRKTLEDQQIQAQATLQNMVASFEKKQAAFQKQAPIMGPSEQQEKYAELEKMQNEIMQTEQALQMDLSEKDMQANETFYSLTNEYMQTIGAELGYDYVISVKTGGQFMYCNPEYDITQVILTRLNEEFAKQGGK